MEFLKEALNKKLEEIEVERQRWDKYQQDHLQAESNLTEFPKSFEVNVLVPIGSKALMPGKLYHTNEIFIAHYTGLYTKCSAHSALEVCKHRLKKSQQQKDGIEAEWQMYQDRLELPFAEDAFVSSEHQQEIIEEYSEEEEKRWRIEHKIKVAEHKKREASNRQEGVDDDSKDYMQILEDALLMEELEKDLEDLGIENDEQLNEQLSGRGLSSKEQNTQELSTPKNAEGDSSQEREDDKDEDEPSEFLEICQQVKNLTAKEQLALYERKHGEVTEYLSEQKITNYYQLNKTAEKRALQECLLNAIEELREELSGNNEAFNENVNEANENIEMSSDTDYSRFDRKEFANLEREYSNRSKGEQLVFYKSQVRNAVKWISARSPSIQEDEMQERRLLYEYLSGKIDSLRSDILKEKQAEMEERFVDDDSDNENDDNDNDTDDTGSVICHDGYENNFEPYQGKRRISFAAEPIVKTYHQDDEPWCILKGNDDNMNSLMDTTFQFFNSPDVSEDEANSEKPCEQINHSDIKTNENEPKIVTILSDSTVEFRDGPTLSINFKHSLRAAWPIERTGDSNFVMSPADIYTNFGPGREVRRENTQSEKSLLKDYVMNVANLDINEVSERMKKMYASKKFQSNEGDLQRRTELTHPMKSILKNKDAVSLENHEKNCEPTENDSPVQRAVEPFNNFDTILGDVLENTDSDSVEDKSKDGSKLLYGPIFACSQNVKDSNAKTNKAPPSHKPVSLFKKSQRR